MSHLLTDEEYAEYQALKAAQSFVAPEPVAPPPAAPEPPVVPDLAVIAPDPPSEPAY